jgi:hypothetical protein
MSDQQLNSLERFRKRSPNLLLEQHDSCEVPAGCGGVILRWRNPRAARPLVIQVYTSGKSELWLDGEPLVRGRLDLAPGRHVLAIAVEEGNRNGLLRAALMHDPESGKGHGPGALEAPLRILSSADGTWKATLNAPPEGWQALAFDDASWGAMRACRIAEVDWGAPGGYQWHACEEAGASGLRVASLPRGEEPLGPAWVRKVFEIPAPPAP